MTLENDLQRTMRRERPDAGFAERVLARIAADEREQARRPKPAWWRAAAASAALVTLLGGYTAHRVQEHRRGLEAREQLLTAMRIAGEKVHYAQQEVRQIGTSTSKEK